jgi:2-polyprenyl-3-methyl-5-hydroxy-6-metoxy-1,4-benzoquinol methylase
MYTQTAEPAPDPSPLEVPLHFRRGVAMDAHQRRRHHAVLSALAQVPPGRLLDYGCGWGDITWAMARTHPDLHAVDVDVDRVAYARTEFSPLEFSVCRPDGLDFPDQSFDVVASVVVLPFVPDDQAYLDEIRRVLRPGGHLVLASKVCPALRHAWHMLGGHPERSRESSTGLRTHTSDDLRMLLQRNGFHTLHRSGFHDPPFQSRKNAGDLLNSTVELVGETLGLAALAPYQVFLARLGEEPAG